MGREMPDILWKEIIEDLFEDFLKFFMPNLYPEVDFSRGYEFLDKELANIVDKTLKGKKMTDRLVKVYLKDGTENWILVHLEVQGYYEKEFGERMFKYFYRIYDKYNKKIVALSIFTDDKKEYKPNKFNYEFHGTKLEYEYNTYKVLEQDEESLLLSDNPFALVVLSGLYTLRSKGETDLRYRFKKRLFRLLIEKGYKRVQIYKIFQFLDGILFLPNELELKFKEDVDEIIGGERNMGVRKEMTNIYQVGKSEGILEGRQEGILEGKIQTAKRMLEKKMGVEQIVQITELPKEEVKRLFEGVKH